MNITRLSTASRTPRKSIGLRAWMGRHYLIICVNLIWMRKSMGDNWKLEYMPKPDNFFNVSNFKKQMIEHVKNISSVNK